MPEARRPVARGGDDEVIGNPGFDDTSHSAPEAAQADSQPAFHASNGIDGPAVAQELKNVGDGLKQMQQLGKYQDVKERAAGTKDFPWSKTKFLWTRHSYKQTGKDVTFTGTRISDTFITAYRDHFLKIRVTTKEEDLEKDQKVIDAFVLEVAKKIEADQ